MKRTDVIEPVAAHKRLFREWLRLPSPFRSDGRGSGCGEVRVYNDMQFGGYLIYQLPEARVFIDDRCELYRDQGLLRYKELQDHPQLIEGLAAYDDLAFALVQSRSSIDRYLSGSPRWRKLHGDAAAALYERFGTITDAR